MGYSSKEKVARGVAWAGASNWGGQLLSFCAYTALARLLDPHAFGQVAIASVYLAFIQLIVTQGFGTAIIQRDDLQDEHLDSAFWIAMATAAFFCLLSLLLTRTIACLFHEPSVAPVIGWLSLSLFFYALSSIPTAILTRALNFRAIAVRSLAATGVGGMVGVAMAWLGWGVWSLVGQWLVGAVLACICLWWSVRWRPRFRISKRHLRDLYGFSLNVAVNDVVSFFSQRSDQTLVGYGFGSSGLGPYSLASRVTTLLYDAITGPFQSVALPAFSRLQSEPSKLERAVRQFCEISSFVALPAFAGIAAVAPELVRLIFGPKWVSAVPILYALAFYGAARVVLAFTYPLLLAKARTGLFLCMTISLSLLTLVGCLVAVVWSPVAIAYSMVLSIAVFGVGFFGVARKVLAIRTGPLLKSFAFPALSSGLMLILVSMLRRLLLTKLSPLPTLTICVAAGVAIYASLVLLLRPDLVKAIREPVEKLLHPLARRGASVSDNSGFVESVMKTAEASESQCPSISLRPKEDGVATNQSSLATTAEISAAAARRDPEAELGDLSVPFRAVKTRREPRSGVLVQGGDGEETCQ